MSLYGVTNAKLISISYSIYTSSRMFIGVYSSIYLLEQGFTFNDLALFSAVFTITIALSEIPIAIFADTKSRKISVLLGMLATIFFYLICIFPNNIFYVCIAYFLYGIAASFISGSVEGILLHSLNNNKDYPSYIHFITKLSSLGSLMAGILSYIIYNETQNFKIMYIIAMLITSINTLVFCGVTENNKNKSKSNLDFRSSFSKSIEILKSIKNAYYYIITASLLTMILQVFFYFWQPVMSYKATNMSSMLIYCYVGVFFIQFIINEIIKKLKAYDYFILQIYLYILSFIFIIFLMVVKNNEYIKLSVLVYVISMGLLTMIPTILHNKLVSSHNEINDQVSTCLSTLSSISRFFSFILLINIYLFFNAENPVNIFYIPLSILIIVLFVHLLWKNKEQKYVIKAE